MAFNSTKDEVHKRRMENYVGAPVSVSQYMAKWRHYSPAEGDSNYKICTVACRSAQTKPTGVNAKDTDIFQLLIHHADPSDYYENMHMITSRHTVCIFTPKINLDPELFYDLLPLHAWSACDTTSRPYGI